MLLDNNYDNVCGIFFYDICSKKFLFFRYDIKNLSYIKRV